MPKSMTETPPLKLAHQRPIRLYKVDDEALRALHLSLEKEYDKDIVQLIRDCVHLGLPLLESQYKPK